MTDTPQDPIEQDDAEQGPRVELRVVLALMRVLAGRRGWARLRWSAHGFTYVLRVMRTDEGPVVLDADPDALGGGVARDALRGHLRVTYPTG